MLQRSKRLPGHAEKFYTLRNTNAHDCKGPGGPGPPHDFSQTRVKPYEGPPLFFGLKGGPPHSQKRDYIPDGYWVHFDFVKS